MTRPLLAYADGPGSPRSAPHVVAAAVGVRDPEVLLGWTLEDRPWLADPDLRGSTVVAGYALRDAVADGRLHYLPVRLSSMPRLLDRMRPDVAVVAGVRRGRGYAFAGSVGWGRSLTKAAASVVVEIADDAIDLGGPPIDVPIAVVLDAPPAGAAVRSRGADDVATAAYVWGDRAVRDLIGAGRLRLRGIEQTHDLGCLARIERFVAANTALQVGLDGSVNVERVGGRVVAGVGGHADFAAGAARSRGGVSIIALRSTTRAGGSTIVERVEVTSTPRCDIDVVVTEHGVADLRGVDDGERAQRIAAIAAPEHR